MKLSFLPLDTQINIRQDRRIAVHVSLLGINIVYATKNATSFVTKRHKILSNMHERTSV